MIFSIIELDAPFVDLQFKEQQCPMSLPNLKSMYKKCVSKIHSPAHNIVCVSCGCIYHDISEFETVPHSFELLRHLQISSDVDISFDLSCHIEILNQNRILIDKLGITIDKRIRLCRSWHNQFSKDLQSTESLANFQ